MRDPDLVQRAERAATALEQAWGHWRVMHGLGTDPLPPVSSYVGYSLEEPWGQPRVVFGVGAEEAERLAALLAGHDCVGPVHAELSARSDWRLAASSGPQAGQTRSFDGTLSVPAQSPPPGAEPFGGQGAGQTTAAGTATDPRGADIGYPTTGAGDAAARATDRTTAGGDGTGRDESEQDEHGATGRPPEQFLTGRTPPSAAQQLEPLPAMPATLGELAAMRDNEALDSGPGLPATDRLRSDRLSSDRARSDRHGSDRPRPDRHGSDRPRSDRPRSDHHGEAGGARLADGSWQYGDQAGTAPLTASEQASVVAFPRRPDHQPTQRDEPVQFAAAPTGDGYDATPSQGPGYRGPRYQGVPPQYQPSPADEDPAAVPGDAAESGSGEASAEQAEQPRAEQPRAEQPRAEQPRAEQSGAEQSGAEQSGAEQSGAEQSGAEQPTAIRAVASQARASQPRASQPRAGQRSAGQPKAAHASASRASTGQPTASQPHTSQPRAVQPGAGQPRAVQPSAGQQSAVQQSAVQQSAVPSKAEPPAIAIQSSDVQSNDVQPGASRPGASEPGPSAGQPKTAQPPPSLQHSAW